MSWPTQLRNELEDWAESQYSIKQFTEILENWSSCPSFFSYGRKVDLKTSVWTWDSGTGIYDCRKRSKHNSDLKTTISTSLSCYYCVQFPGSLTSESLSHQFSDYTCIHLEHSMYQGKLVVSGRKLLTKTDAACCPLVKSLKSFCAAWITGFPKLPMVQMQKLPLLLTIKGHFQRCSWSCDFGQHLDGNLGASFYLCGKPGFITFGYSYQRRSLQKPETLCQSDTIKDSDNSCADTHHSEWRHGSLSSTWKQRMGRT